MCPSLYSRFAQRPREKWAPRIRGTGKLHGFFGAKDAPQDDIRGKATLIACDGEVRRFDPRFP